MTNEEMLAGLREAVRYHDATGNLHPQAMDAIRAAITALEAAPDHDQLQSLPDAPPRERAEKPTGNVPRCFARPSPGQPSGGPCELESGHVGWHRRGGMEWAQSTEAAPAQVEAPPSESAMERARRCLRRLALVEADGPWLAAEFDQHANDLLDTEVDARLNAERGSRRRRKIREFKALVEDNARLRAELEQARGDHDTLLAAYRNTIAERDAALAKVADLERDLAHLRENAGEDSCADVLAKARAKVAAMRQHWEWLQHDVDIALQYIANKGGMRPGPTHELASVPVSGLHALQRRVRAALAELDKEQGR